MNNLAKRSLALILALVLCLSLLPVTVVPVSAASYIYNWGTRGEVATTLSAYAQAFYTGNNTYDALSALAGGTSKDNAPNSNLYNALRNLMTDAHTSPTSYDGTRELYRYTDCQKGGGAISSIYTGTEIGPDWDSGATWNREHTWPQSKAPKDKNGVAGDIMMIRGATVSENSSRGNTAYGEGSGYLDPNSFSGGALNVRGDVARSFLYVYVRWANSSNYFIWGVDGVMESPEILLKWMTEDPVDTWEMGRNDSVQSITGTRNVFVDYPELAFQLFGEEVPADMTTPSREGASAEQPNAPAEKPVVYVTEINTLSFADKAQRTSFSTTQQVWEQNGITFTNDKASSTNAVADYAKPVRLYANSKVTVEHPGMTKIVFDCNSSSYATALKNAIGTPANGKVSVSSDKVTVEFTEKTDSFEIAKLTAQVRIDSITVTAEVAVTCDHTNTKTVGVQPATCVAEGYTGDLVCADCEDVIAAGNKIPVIDHNYVDGACSACGAKDLSAVETTTATITFDVADGKRTTYDTTQQVWVENGITVTNLKAKSSSNVADAVAPVKFYAHSSLNVTFPGMLQIVFNCNNETYASALKDSISVGVVELDKTVVTVTFTEAISGFDIADLSAKVFMDSITVTAVACDHAETTVEGKVDVTCTTDGHTGAIVCLNCGATIDAGEVIVAPGHKYVDGACDVCGEGDPSVTPDDPETTAGGKADFNTIDSTNGSSSYGGSYTTQDGWTIVNSAIHVGTSSTDSNPKFQVVGPDNTYKAVCINGKTTAVGKITSPTLAGGITKLTMRYTFMFADTKLGAIITVTDLVTGATYTDTIDLAVTSAEKLQVKDYQWVLETPITGAFTIEVVNSCPSNSTSNKDRMTILELAWEAPADAPACDHTNTTLADQKDATCTEDGYTGNTICAACGVTIAEGEAIGKLGHNFADGVCQRCGVKAPETAVTTKQAYKFGMIQYNVSPTKLYYLTGAMDGYYMATTSVADEAVDVYMEETESGYYLYTYINSVKHYINMVVNGNYVNGAFEAAASTVYTFDAEKGTLIATVNDTAYMFGTANNTTYTTVGPVKVAENGFYCQLYKFVEGNPNEPTCQHTNTTVVGAVEATCTEDGYSGDIVCDACGVTVTKGETIAASHKYEDDVCTVCGDEKPLIATITFDDRAKRTEYSTTKQVWVENGIIVTNDKAASTTNVGDYAKPARFYKDSNLKIEYPNMTQIVIDCTGLESKYVTAYESIEGATVVNGFVTITFAQPVNEFVITGLSAQARANSITISYAKVAPACEEHSFVEGVCSVCGHKLGDIDGNEALTHEDAVYLLLYTMFPENYPLNGAYGNVDGDQDVDQDDAVYLLLNVLFGDDFYPLQIIAVLPENEEEAEG